MTQPYIFQLDTNHSYKVIFNDRNIDLSPENEFVINSSKAIGNLKIYQLNDVDTVEVLNKKIRYYNMPIITPICFGKYGSYTTITKKDLNTTSYINTITINYDLNINFAPKHVDMRYIGSSGIDTCFSFKGFEVPQDVIDFLKNADEGILTFRIEIYVAEYKQYINSFYYFEKDSKFLNCQEYLDVPNLEKYEE